MKAFTGNYKIQLQTLSRRINFPSPNDNVTTLVIPKEGVTIIEF